MVKQKYNWQTSTKSDQALITELAQATDLSPVLCELLVQKGYQTPEAIQKFIQPSEKNLYDPYLMHDMAVGVERIRQAIYEQEKIVIYGDYDADGITSTSVMYETLEQLGAVVEYYIPDRFTDGYGPNKAVYQYLIDMGAQLIITVDNGVSGAEAISYAKSRGVDVVVTDHHELPQELPTDAVAIIHPRHPQGEYPFGDLAGVGVAFKVATALLEGPPSDLLDLVAIGTVADLVSLTDENRALVKFGINALQNTYRSGLLALFAKGQIEQATIDEVAIGFKLAPRLNALGRMESGQIGVELLTSLDDERVEEIAEHVQTLNNQRIEIVDAITQAALQQAQQQSDHLINVVWQENWHEGVLGIVASRLVEATNKPTLVLNYDPEKELLKGSGRSVAGFNLYQGLDPHRDLLTSFGGHHMACGLTVAKDQIENLIAILEEEAQKQELTTEQKSDLQLAGDLTLAEVDLDLLAEIEKLKPYGTDNEQPYFAFHDYRIEQAQIVGKNQNCLRLMLSATNQQKITAIGFSLPDATLQKIVQQPNGTKIVGSLNKNVWKNNVSAQIMLKDVAYEGIYFNDLREQPLTTQSFQQPGTYLFFDTKKYQALKQQVPTAENLVLAQQVIQQGETITTEQLTIVDLPADLTEIAQVLPMFQTKELSLYGYHQEKVYLMPMPTREDFSKLYRFVMSQTDFNLRTDLTKLENYLKIKKELLIFMIKVFFEVGFVRIEDGLMTGNKNASYHKLETTTAYRQRLSQIEVQELLLQKQSNEIAAFLGQYLNK
ncbi:single-stranded-DNA-specific exonuclease RecJ [Ligilactobacillus ceti]|uniref:single-stranded-DNA-specific exonuclease RecJ n=1 Tax=Ligilactobacillus ceti TaxID=395085 RepID=UPI000410167C|nr:single-stranded-DNA-specific exonuclease RecJ [Ligilactobacillus ceti]